MSTRENIRLIARAPLGKNNQFYIKIYRNPKTFFKISFPPPPVCQQKLLHVHVLPYYTHCMEVACWHKGGGKMFRSPKTQGLSL